jgi:alkylhydroperoxidase family enzyme
MALKPEMLKTALPFMQAIYGEGRVSFELKRLVGMMSSWSAGCQYCVAHTAHGAANLGISTEKIAALPLFETDPLYSESERSALRLARSAGQTPSAVTDAEFAALRQWFDDEQIVEIVAVVALFGFLNRWNATFSTELEQSPLRFAEQHLRGVGWQAGTHA